MEGRILTPLRAPQRATSGLGARLRQLRVAAGLTQSELAGDRFSKEYVSQIERGKTRPTKETLAWIGERLGVDVSYLETGQSLGRVRRGRGGGDARRGRGRGPAVRRGARGACRRCSSRPRHGSSSSARSWPSAWARMQHAELRPALELLTRARELSEAARLLRRRAGRRPLPDGCLPLQADVDQHRADASE